MNLNMSATKQENEEPVFHERREGRPHCVPNVGMTAQGVDCCLRRGQKSPIVGATAGVDSDSRGAKTGCNHLGERRRKSQRVSGKITRETAIQLNIYLPPTTCQELRCQR